MKWKFDANWTLKLDEENMLKKFPWWSKTQVLHNHPEEISINGGHVNKDKISSPHRQDRKTRSELQSQLADAENIFVV